MWTDFSPVWKGRGLQRGISRFRRLVRVAEAAALLIAARLLIRFVPMVRWRNTLGQPHTEGAVAQAGDDRAAEVLAYAVVRAARLLPLPFLCLPRAMALQWMLRRRGIGSVLVMGATGGRTDQPALHAWVERKGCILIGEDEHTYVPVLTIG